MNSIPGAYRSSKAEGERAGLLEDVLRSCVYRLYQDPGRGNHGLCPAISSNSELCNNMNFMLLAVAFQFLRVGDSLSASELLERLDKSAAVGDNVHFCDRKLTELACPDLEIDC